MRRRPLSKIVAAVVPVALVLAVSQVPSASAAAVGVTSVTVAGSFNSEIGCSADWSPPCPEAHLTARADGKFEGTFTIPASGDGQPYQYKFATNDDFSNPNFGLQGGSGNIVLRVPAGGAVGDVRVRPRDEPGIGLDQQRRAVRELPDPTRLPGERRQDLPAELAVRHRRRRHLHAGHRIDIGWHLSGLGDHRARHRRHLRADAFTVPAAGGGATTTISFDSATNEVSTSVVPLVQAPPATFGHPTARRGRRHGQPLVMELEVRRPGMHDGARTGRLRRRPGCAAGELDQQPEQ